MDFSCKFFLLFICILPAISFADPDSLAINQNTYSLGLDFGAAMPTNIGNSTSFPLGLSTFSYNSNNYNNQASIAGISLSRLFSLLPLYSVQIGVSYHYISNMNVEGTLMQGIAPPYYQANYSYNIKSSQYMVDAKLRRQFQAHSFPYIYLGLGVASNRASDYTTNVPPYLTVTPTYNNKTTNAFTYSVGFGIDYVIQNISIGIGYRFINLGKTGLGSGMIRNTSVNPALTQSNLYVNSLFGQFNYFI